VPHSTTFGHDEAILDHVTSANIACGFHAGDPGTMRRGHHPVDGDTQAAPIGLPATGAGRVVGCVKLADDMYTSPTGPTASAGTPCATTRSPPLEVRLIRRLPAELGVRQMAVQLRVPAHFAASESEHQGPRRSASCHGSPRVQFR